MSQTLPAFKLYGVKDVTSWLPQMEFMAVQMVVMGGLHSRNLIVIILLAINHTRGGLIMAEVLVRDLDTSVVERLKARAAANGRSLQAELKAILEAQASQVTKAEARALAAHIRRRIDTRPQTDSGILQAEDRER